MNYANHLAGPVTQFDRTDPRQVPNSDGALVFSVGPFERLERFLILGSEGGTYYATERQLTRDNAASVGACADEDPHRTVRTIVQVSQWGRAPKQSPALFALALCAAHASPVMRKAALDALPLVCRTASHLFEFVGYADQLRGWGAQLCRAVGAWYSSKAPEQLAYQLTKYRQRGGWSHRDVLRKAHPRHGLFSAQQQALIRWTVAGPGALGERDVVRKDIEALDRQVGVGEIPESIWAFEQLQIATSAEHAAQLILAHGFTHEMVPAQFKNERVIWEALLPTMPLGTLVRNLGKLTEIGILSRGGEWAQQVASRITDLPGIRKARLHPIAFLSAQMVYRSGHGVKGKLAWTPAPEVTAALESAFYLAFGNVESSGKRLLLGLDVSGSMQSGQIAGIPGLTPAMAAAAMALVTLRREPHAVCMGFSHQFIPLGITAEMSLDQAMRATSGISFGATDCSLPMRWAAGSALGFDGFSVYTDSETNQNQEHPYQALERYRRETDIPARLAVVAFASTGFTIANPSDAGMLDVVGFDSSAPAVLGDFFRGKQAREGVAVPDDS